MSESFSLEPNDKWFWYFDKKYNCLMLHISNEMAFRSHYPVNLLVTDAFEKRAFTIEHIKTYQNFYEKSEYLNLTNPKRVELTLNAIVAANFLKPTMPKSWYFKQQDKPYVPNVGEIVKASITDEKKEINLFVIESGINASVCLITDLSINLANKNFLFCDVIKVMNDRLMYCVR